MQTGASAEQASKQPNFVALVKIHNKFLGCGVSPVQVCIAANEAAPVAENRESPVRLTFPQSTVSISLGLDSGIRSVRVSTQAHVSFEFLCHLSREVMFGRP